MKLPFLILFLFVSTISFSQTLELKKIENKKYSFFDSYTFEKINILENNLKTTAPFISLDIFYERRLVFIPQNFNMGNSNQDFSKYFLQDELRKVMLEIPGLQRPINHNPFN